ncbi:MAG TPA: hypothetical protein VD978_07785 [Azospirillum sp.]|nr:hypothetical protein [Azospirillum sp.]
MSKGKGKGKEMDEAAVLATMLVESLAALERADPAAAAAIIGPSRPWQLSLGDDVRMIKRADAALAAVGSSLPPWLATQFEAVVKHSRSLADKIEEAA